MSYKSDFLGTLNIIEPPGLVQTKLKVYDINGLNKSDFFLDYHHFSLLQNPIRKFPFFTIANIDGTKFRMLPRKDAWKFDDRIDKIYQWGSALYEADMSDFDKGHMTKREDVQWGINDEDAQAGAQSTFYYTNAIPQVDKMNRGIWSKIESYILHTQTINQHQKITLLTGPIFDDNDPEFVTVVNDETLKIPTLFWKVIYYLGSDNDLHRTAFIVNQKNILEKRRIVKPQDRSKDVAPLFMNFKDAETYQTQVSLIESLSGLLFTPAKEIYNDSRPSKLIAEQTEVRSKSLNPVANILIKNLKI